MSQTVNVNFKLDADVKKSMEQACAELGLSMSAAFTVFAKKVGREKRIPFEVSLGRQGLPQRSLEFLTDPLEISSTEQRFILRLRIFLRGHW